MSGLYYFERHLDLGEEALAEGRSPEVHVAAIRRIVQANPAAASKLQGNADLKLRFARLRVT